MSRGQDMDEDALAKLRHDIKNQLSNIHLALDTLKYEVTDPSEDFLFCVESIQDSATKINQLLSAAE
jgi:nitrogen-specific signal transduction histidine kinase